MPLVFLLYFSFSLLVSICDIRVQCLLSCKTTLLFYNNHQYAAWLKKEEVIQG
jgi:hypothetical protein